MNTSRPCHFVIACGGTGGHLFPGISVAQALREKGHRATLLISEKQVDGLAASKYGDLDFRKVPAIGMPRLYTPAVFPFLRRLWATIKECRRILDEVNADFVLGMGGFTSLPPVYAARRKGIPSFIHDSNALPGKANRLTARWCRKVLLGVQEATPYFPHNVTVVTGTPVRLELMESIDKKHAAEKLGLDPSRKTILVMGGSQGARQLNTLVIEAALAMESGYQFFVIAGQSDYERVRDLASSSSSIKVVPFCSEMAAAYACADLAISRSGASSLTELAFFGIPSLLVPFPFAADDHQAHNARVYSVNGAAQVIRQSVLDPEIICQFIEQTLESPEKLRAMKQAAKDNSVPNAAVLIADAMMS